MKNRLLSVVLRWFLLLFFLLIACFIVLLRIRKIIFISAKSKAENIILDAANRAVINVLQKNEIDYKDISIVSKNANGDITSIEINTNKINMLKSQISEEMYRIVEKNEEYGLSIPIGTLLNYEYTSGYGPCIRFKMRLAHSEKLSFKSKFCDAGINNVLHQIIINTEINYSVLAAGSSRSFKVKNDVIAAQTVIAGKIPESFTNVEEGNESDIADDIFNFRE